jgi:hypothetical protein
MVTTGGKSVHCYWIFQEPIAADIWEPLQHRLLVHCKADTSISNPSRVMRLPGFAYIGKDTGKPTGSWAELIHVSTARYSPQELEQCLPAPPAAAAPAPLLQALQQCPQATGVVVPFRDFLSKAAVTLIDTGSREGSCNDDGLKLSLELVAVENWLAQQGARADETAREAYACYLSHCPKTINGAPFDTRAAWGRFDGAAAQHPAPATPEEKLLQRLAFHCKEPSQPANNVLPISGARSAAEVFRDEEPSAGGAPAQKGSKPKQQEPELTPWQRQKQAALADCLGDPVKESRAMWGLLISRSDEIIRSDCSISEQRQHIKAVAKALNFNLSKQEIDDIYRQRDSLLACDEPDVEPGGTFTTQDQSWLLHEVFLNALNLLVGMPGAGKSLLVAALVRAFLDGQTTFLGRALVDGSKRNVLLIGTDQDRQQWSAILEPLGLATRVGTTADADGIELPEWRLHERIHLKTLGGGFRLDADGLREIRNWNQANPGGLGILDSLGAVLPPDISEVDEAVGRLIRDLDRARRGNPWVLLHHVNKVQGLGGNAGVYCGSGHGSIDRAVSRVIGLTYETHIENGKEKLHEESPRRVLTSQKRGGPNQRLIVEMGHRNTWDYISTAAEDREMKRQDREGDAADCLKGWKKAVHDTLASAAGWLTTSQVTAALPTEYARKANPVIQARRALRELAEAGLIEEDPQSIGENRWRLDR